MNEHKYGKKYEEVQAQRKRYMNGEITHQEYYLWLADLIGATVRDIPVSLNRLAASTDTYFNDIPLSTWDRQHYHMKAKAMRAGLLVWSLSDTTCVLKALARKAVKEEEGKHD